MNATLSDTWHEANQRYLMAALGVIREALQGYVDQVQGKFEVKDEGEALKALKGAAAAMSDPPALEMLCETFGLSKFERDVLLLCAGMELDAAFPRLYATAQGGKRQAYPTFSLAMAALPNADWGALTPSSPLHYWRLIEVENARTYTLSPLRIDRWVLHYLVGMPQLDERLLSVVKPLPGGRTLIPSYQAIAQRVAASWLQGMRQGTLPIVQLCGDEVIAKRAIAATACAMLGVNLYVMSVHAIPQSMSELDSIIRLWERQGAVEELALLLDCDALEAEEATRECGINWWLESTGGMVMVSRRDRRRLPQRSAIAFEVGKPTADEQRTIWASCLDEDAASLNGQVDGIVSQFNLSAAAIQAVCLEVKSQGLTDEEEVENLTSPTLVNPEESTTSQNPIPSTLLNKGYGVHTSSDQPQNIAFRPPSPPTLGGTGVQSPPGLGSQCGLGVSPSRTPGVDLGGKTDLYVHSSLNKGGAMLENRLWDICRMQARPRLDDLAQRIEPAASWQDLVLPEAQLQILREIAIHLRQRGKVYESWKFAAKGNRGLGISALFAGSSGTGKTMAAEVLAQELRLDVYRIDLSSVVSKYIGETEKNLRRVFDAAEAGGTILLFDEADALFGKRSEVKDSHDRYANIEVSYLLQRMEAYRGLAILTTNLKDALDTAFLRRIRFVVQFPFPDVRERVEIWRRIFPSQVPTEGLDVQKLAQLNVAGGNIRNIAMNAAFLAADAGEAVGMCHLLRAAKSEYAKLEKSLTDVEVRGWV